MKVLNDFECLHCGASQEHLVDNEETSVTCLDCGNIATKQRRPIRAKLDFTFPGEADKWEKRRAQKLKEEQAHSGYDPH